MQTADLPGRARAFVQHYFDGKDLPVALGRLGRLTSVGLGRSNRQGGRAVTGRIELTIEPTGAEPFVLYAEPRSGAPHLASTVALNISYIAPGGRDHRRFAAVSRALTGYFASVDSLRGPPDPLDFFGPPGDPLVLAANSYAVRSKRIEAIIFPTDMCNLRCSYCIVPFGKNTMTKARIDTIFGLLRGQDPEAVSVTFLGGEPMLHWPTIQDVSERMAAWWPQPPLCIVTNGTFLKDEHARFFADHRFNVTLSIDGAEASHALHRVHNGPLDPLENKRLFGKTMDAVDRLLAVGADLNANMVVTPDTVGQLAANSEWLFDRGIPILTVSPAVGVRWGAAADVLQEQLAAWGQLMRGRMKRLDRPTRAAARGVLQWEIRRSVYFLGQGAFNPTTRRLCFAPDGQIYSDLYNDATAPMLHLADMDEVGALDELPPNETTVPQAMFAVRAWDEDILRDVRVISTLLLNELLGIDQDAFEDELGAAELHDHLPKAPLPLPA